MQHLEQNLVAISSDIKTSISHWMIWLTLTTVFKCENNVFRHPKILTKEIRYELSLYLILYYVIIVIILIVVTE